MTMTTRRPNPALPLPFQAPLEEGPEPQGGPFRNSSSHPFHFGLHACLRTLGRVSLGIVLAMGVFLTPADRVVAETLGDSFTQEEIEPLLDALTEVGFQRDSLTGIFYDPRLRRMDRVVRINSMNPDKEAMYKDFTGPYAIMVSRRFVNKHRKLLEQAERQYRVPKEIITAILLVETQFGQAKLPYNLLNVFTTLAVEGRPGSVEKHFERLRATYPDLDREWLSERIQKKAEFGFQELSAFLVMHWKNAEALFQTQGSYAGALGIPQFLPSSYLQWAVDGDEDGDVDLNSLEDAVPSVGNYLRQHGWTPEAPFQEKWDSIFAYNQSEHYVRTIIEVAFRLDTPRKPKARRKQS